MRRRAIAFLALALVAGGTVALRLRLEERVTATGVIRPADRPNSLFGALVGGAFRPLFLEYLWTKADALAREGRNWEVVEIHGRITRLDPDNPRAYHAQAWWLTYDLAQSEPDPPERWRLYRRAIDHVRAGLARHPDDWPLLDLRFEIFFSHVAADPYLDRQCRANLGADGLAMALDAAYAMRAAHPDRPAAWDALRVAGEETVERLLNVGRTADGARGMEELAAIGVAMRQRFPDDPVAAEVATSYPLWVPILRALETTLAAFDESGDAGPEGEALLADLEARIEALAGAPDALRTDPEVERFDAALVALIHSRIMGLAQRMLLAKRPSAALPHLDWVGRLARLTEGRLGPRMPYYTEAYVSLLRQIAELDAAWREASGRRDPSAAALRDRLERSLEDLDRRFRERTGRSDGFTSRFVADRFGA
ncbi:MAG: hypothetical protein R3F20_05635 [Planctomycetota bacterium]